LPYEVWGWVPEEWASRKAREGDYHFTVVMDESCPQRISENGEMGMEISGKFWSEVPPGGTCIDRSHADYFDQTKPYSREKHAEMHGLAYRSTEKSKIK
jgi:hypothetical protein